MSEQATTAMQSELVKAVVCPIDFLALEFWLIHLCRL